MLQPNPIRRVLRARAARIQIVVFTTLLAGVTISTPARLRAQAQVQGRITNGTTRRPVAGLEVRLLSPRQQMHAVATASSDSDGNFAFTSQIDASGFYLAETTYQGARYHEPVRFESPGAPAKVNFTVYESTSSAELRVQLLRLLVRVDGGKAQVREQYEVENSTHPPRSYANPKGTFRFSLPAGAGQPSVTVTGLLNMPLPQEAEAGKSPGEFFLVYALKPGVTEINVDYQADYSAASMVLGERSPYQIDHAELYIFPSNVAADSAVLKPAGVDSKNSIEKLEADNVAAGSSIEAKLSGEAVAPPSAASSGEEGKGGDGQEVKIVPEQTTRLALPLLGCFLLLLLWALGVRTAKEWPRLSKSRANAGGPVPGQAGPIRLSAKAEKLITGLADLDELFASGKIAEKDYWKERLELKARLVESLKKRAPRPLESYASRRTSK